MRGGEMEGDHGRNEMKKIEDPAQRQVTYCKRRNGIFKKAHELSVLCDAEVSIIMCSTNNKLHTYTTPTTTMKKIIDQYQRTLGVDVWSSHYEKMQEEWRRMMDVNYTLRRDIRQRIGEDELNDMNMEQLWSLEEMMLKSLEAIRERKYQVIRNQTDTCKKKLRNLQDMQHHLLYNLEVKYEYPHGLVEDKGEDGNSTAAAFANGMPRVFPLRLRESHCLRLDEAERSFQSQDSCVSGVTMETKNLH